MTTTPQANRDTLTGSARGLTKTYASTPVPSHDRDAAGCADDAVAVQDGRIA